MPEVIDDIEKKCLRNIKIKFYKHVSLSLFGWLVLFLMFTGTLRVYQEGLYYSQDDSSVVFIFIIIVPVSMIIILWNLRRGEPEYKRVYNIKEYINFLIKYNNDDEAKNAYIAYDKINMQKGKYEISMNRA